MNDIRAAFVVGSRARADHPADEWSDENDIKTLLLQMMEWHAKALHGEDFDVWHAGRFLDEWVDQDTLKELKNTFGHYEKNDSFKALIATMNLFRRLSIEVANKLQLRYPSETDKNITNWIK